MKTRRAEIIEACEQAATSSGIAVLAHMPRMAEFYRKRANEQLRAARASGDPVAVADAKAKLELLRWAEGWMRGPLETWGGHTDAPHVHRMNQDLSMIGYALQYLVQAYADHPQFRPEWLRPSY